MSEVTRITYEKRVSSIAASAVNEANGRGLESYWALELAEVACRVEPWVNAPLNAALILMHASNPDAAFEEDEHPLSDVYRFSDTVTILAYHALLEDVHEEILSIQIAEEDSRP